MNNFNVRAGTYGDTTDKLERLTRREDIACDAAARLLQEGAEYLIGGKTHLLESKPVVKGPTQELHL